ncbi:MAG: insulinase family protein, partial [Bdellovibrio sp.]
MYKKFQLKNGLKVLLIQSSKSPVVSVQMWVKTGSADERRVEAGVSHFIEHLLFKGTRKYGVGEIAAAVEGSGGMINAYTSLDETVFYVTLSKDFLETGFDIISEMMGFPLFDPDEVDREREVVIEEIKRGQDNPHRQANRLLFSTLYRKHPYKEPVIGYENVIRKISVRKIKEYFNTHYVPSNMTLLVVGDFQGPIKKQIEKYFLKISKRTKKLPSRVKEPVITRPRVKVKKSSFKDSLLNMAWPTPKAQHKDIPVREVLSVLLGQGASSRLMKAQKKKKPLANYSSAYLMVT